jgi:hypothetical protein
LNTFRYNGLIAKFRPFHIAREFAHKLKLKNQKEWYNYCSSGRKPDDIPANVPLAFKKEWNGWGDWLGTGAVATQKRKYRPFKQAREYVRNLGLKSRDEWFEYCKSSRKPNDIPSNPNKAYKREFGGYSDWIGYEGTWTKLKVKELLRHLIKSKIIYQWDEGCSLFLFPKKGSLKLIQ